MPATTPAPTVHCALQSLPVVSVSGLCSSDAEVRRESAETLGLAEDRFAQFLKRPPSQLQLIRCLFNPNIKTGAPGLGAHTNYECFTILLPTAPGLEVEGSRGLYSFDRDAGGPR